MEQKKAIEDRQLVQRLFLDLRTAYYSYFIDEFIREQFNEIRILAPKWPFEKQSALWVLGRMSHTTSLMSLAAILDDSGTGSLRVLKFREEIKKPANTRKRIQSLQTRYVNCGLKEWRNKSIAHIDQDADRVTLAPLLLPSVEAEFLPMLRDTYGLVFEIHLLNGEELNFRVEDPIQIENRARDASKFVIENCFPDLN